MLSPGCQRSYRESLKPIRAYFVDARGDPTLDLVRAADVEAFLSWRRARPLRGKRVGNRTLAKDRAVLHRLFADAERLEFIPSNPVARTKPPKADGRTPVILTDDEYQRLVAACDDPMLRLYVVLLGETGMRCESEALWLKWDDVDLEDGFITIESGRDGHRTKSGKSRHVPMTARLLAGLRDHFAEYRFGAYGGQRSEWVFHHSRTRRRHRAGERIASLRNGFEAAARRAQLPNGLHQHDLRHRRVTTWLAEGQNPVHVKEALGHSDLRTTMGYTHLAKEHLRALVEDPKARNSGTRRMTL
jgi:integrase